MVMQIKLVVVVVASSILIMIDRSAHVSNSFKTYALSVEIIAIVSNCYCCLSCLRPGRLLNFWTLRVGAYLRWALIQGWAVIEF